MRIYNERSLNPAVILEIVCSGKSVLIRGRVLDVRLVARSSILIRYMVVS